MNTLAALFIFGLCFAGMAIGLILAQKPLKKGCSDDPKGCRCRNEGIDPNECSS